MWPFSPSYPELSLDKVDAEYDYIIVGGGTAGAVLANRLSANPATKVLVVERGPVADTWASRVPLLSSDFASDGSRTRKVLSKHQGQLGRAIELFTGSVLGGTTRINQMIYTRGLPAEYDAWRDSGCRGWGWDDIEPYFLKSERALYSCDRKVHGTTGEWRNQTSSKFEFPGFHYVVSACKGLSLPFIEDVNSPEHPSIGCGALHFTRDEQQRRHSTYHAFLPSDLANRRASNLHILTNTVVEYLQIETLSTGRLIARGVSMKSRTGSSAKGVKATKEVILCAGPFGSPHLLMLSGIGPSAHLSEHDIATVKDLPGVGANLQDHFGVSVAYGVQMCDSLLSLEKRPWIFFLELFRYLLFGTGMLLAPVVQLVIFASSTLLNDRGQPSKTDLVKADTLPDIEIMPMAYDTTDRPEKSRGMFSFLNVLLHPKSKGTVRLSSKNPQDPLIIDPQYLTHPDDFVPLRAAIKLTLRIRERMTAEGYSLADWDKPEGEDDESLDKFIRRRNRTTYHYSSTCRMAAEEKDGVVNEELFVHGFDNLRVADSSVFPWVLGTHLQAPTVAVAEKCADMVLKEKRD